MYIHIYECIFMYMSLLIMYIHIYVYDMWAFSCMFIYMRALYMICVICFGAVYNVVLLYYMCERVILYVHIYVYDM